MDRNTYVMWLHLSALLNMMFPFLGTVVKIVMWNSKKEEKDEFLNNHAKEAINFEISMIIYSIVALVLCVVLIGLLLLPVLAIYSLVVIIVSAVKGSEGKEYRYPMIIRFVK